MNISGIELQRIDPEWTYWAKCPVEGCKAVSHGCCADHTREAVEEHMAEEHSTWGLTSIDDE